MNDTVTRFNVDVNDFWEGVVGVSRPNLEDVVADAFGESKFSVEHFEFVFAIDVFKEQLHTTGYVITQEVGENFDIIFDGLGGIVRKHFECIIVRGEDGEIIIVCTQDFVEIRLFHQATKSAQVRFGTN